MIVGNGQIATIFKNDADQAKYKNICIFASGVSNSSCTDEKEFKREEDLLLKNLDENKGKKFIYFSSCALSAPEYPRNDYYNHKERMEQLIKDKTCDYLICRVPQLFGDLKRHNTLINFLYDSIVSGKDFTVYSEAYRYVIEINDLKKIVDHILGKNIENIQMIDIGFYKKYSVVEIVKIIEGITKKTARYNIVIKSDEYDLSFHHLKDLLDDVDIGVSFSSNYLKEKLTKKFKKLGAF